MSYRRQGFLWGIILALGQSLCAQQIDTTLLLSEITVLDFYAPESVVDTNSTTPLLPFLQMKGTVGDLLANYSPVFIKQYGAGQLASSSIRGGSAAHTTLKWNGISLQNPMLGQVDLSSIPSFFIDKTGISYGNEYGINNTEIGAVIHIDNLPLDRVVKRIQTYSSIGSFGQYEAGVGFHFQRKKWQNRTRLFGLNQKNNYPYTDLSGKRIQQTHARQTQLGILQEIGLQSNPHSEWAMRLWLQENHRQIPKNKLQNEQVAEQKNNILRTQLTWDNHRNSTVKMAFIDDNFVYDDTLHSIHSLNRTRAFQAGYLHRSSAPLLWAVHYQYTTAMTNNYSQNVRRQEWKGEVQYQMRSKYQHRLLLLKLQGGLTDEHFNPLLPTISLSQKWKHLQWQWSISRKYRLPSFNDLYWSEGGNPDLLPEKGWESILNTKWKKGIFSLTTTLFGKLINQWIIWQPGNSGLWSPTNAQQVGSRGVELKAAILQSKASLPWSITGQYFYTQSTQLKGENRDRQLIYQPRHQVIVRGLAQLHSWQFSYNHKVTGRVFTTTDNSESLSGYGLGTLSLQKEWNRHKSHLITTLQIENVWNNDYETVAFYPMPRRSWHLNIFYWY